jgi:endonuclease/exonuclease/phosphatase (EEP) superfamily protein YafD
VLHSKELQLAQVNVLQTKLSDHSPVLADFKLPQK